MKMSPRVLEKKRKRELSQGPALTIEEAVNFMHKQAGALSDTNTVADILMDQRLKTTELVKLLVKEGLVAEDPETRKLTITEQGRARQKP